MIREELRAVVQDIGDHGVIHANISAWNLLRFTGEDTPETRCPRHKVTHRWRVIDFDVSLALDLATASPATRLESEFVDVRGIGCGMHFWGTFVE